MESVVTYPWLIGSAIAIIGIVLTLSFSLSNRARKEAEKKVDVGVCDQKHIPIFQALSKLDKINDSVIRIEAILNGKKA